MTRGKEDILIATCATLIIASSLSKSKRRPRKIWVKSWLAERDRKGS